MSVLGLGLAGVIVGAAGSELLRAVKPDLVEKIQASAKEFVDRLAGPERDDAESEEAPRDE